MIEVERACQEFASIKVSRGTFEQHWKEVAEVFWPEASQFSGEVRTPGEKKRQQVFDSTGSRALEKGSSAFGYLVHPRGHTYQRLSASVEELNENPRVRAYFEAVTKTLLKERARPKAGFYAACSEVDRSLMAFGTGALLVEEELDEEATSDAMAPVMTIRYQPFHLSELYLLPDGYTGIACFFRSWSLPAYTILQRFGDRTPDKVRRAVEAKNLMQPFELLHVVKPRPLAQRRSPLDHRYDSLLLLQMDKTVITEGGYHEMPIAVVRWSVAPGEVYGRGPGMQTLPDNKSLQAMMRTHLAAGQRSALPPLLASTDAIAVGGRKLNLRSDAINYGGLDIQGRPLVAPMQSGARLDITLEMMQQVKSDIEDPFLVSFFRALIDHPDMTATQVLAILQEKASIIAPPVERYQIELLGPVTHRELGLLHRQGRLLDPPNELIDAGLSYEIEYESQATRAQHMEEALAVSRTAEIMASYVQMDPLLLQNIRGDKAFQRVAYIAGVAADLINDQGTMDEIRRAAAERQEMEAAVAAAPGLAGAAKDVVDASQTGAAA
jgi:hypothetical protein